MAVGFIPILSVTNMKTVSAMAVTYMKTVSATAVTNMKTVSATSSIGGMIASTGYPFGTNTFGYLGFGGF